MTHRTNLILALLLTVTLSCKTKKTIVTTPAPVSQTSDKDLDKMKKDLPDDQIERTDKGIKFTFGSEVLFPTNSSYLSEAAKKRITAVANVIKDEQANNILIEGHSDKTGTATYNKWLSEKRAASVKNFLVSQGIPANKIKTAGLGDTKPVADNKTPEGRLKNRRVEINLLKS
ncbi:OmpA family protein [Pedobacter gandavensis]|uniref:OmpA family protein n=1 Tax=Pedobacter gandavensis TaxID=2679963 RepID=A0ABR6EVM8_9SPHI|nr:OmpA family protein [Pedobacter gandavensis]MBB2149328.1 OmpA family protein [Pedobacter gandavensis]